MTQTGDRPAGSTGSDSHGARDGTARSETGGRQRRANSSSESNERRADFGQKGILAVRADPDQQPRYRRGTAVGGGAGVSVEQEGRNLAAFDRRARRSFHE